MHTFQFCRAHGVLVQHNMGYMLELRNDVNFAVCACVTEYSTHEQLILKPQWFLMTYRIAVNFGEVFNLANWRFYRKSPNLKPANIMLYTITLHGRACDRQI